MLSIARSQTMIGDINASQSTLLEILTTDGVNRQVNMPSKIIKRPLVPWINGHQKSYD